MQSLIGELAQLVRAFDWQSKGHRFESGILHKENMAYYVYILKARYYDTFYYGQTKKLQKRLEKHNKGYSKYTKNYTPWDLYAYKEYESRKEALKMERKLKNLKSRIRLFQFIKKHKFITTTEWMGDSSYILHTTDGGKTFEMQKTRFGCIAIQMLNEDEGYAGGYQGRI